MENIQQNLLHQIRWAYNIMTPEGIIEAYKSSSLKALKHHGTTVPRDVFIMLRGLSPSFAGRAFYLDIVNFQQSILKGIGILIMPKHYNNFSIRWKK